MVRSKFRIVAFVAVLAVCFGTTASAQEAPTNAQLYEMIKQLQAQQTTLAKEAAAAKAEAAKAKAELAATKAELAQTKNQVAVIQSAPAPAPSAYDPGSKALASYKDATTPSSERYWAVYGDYLYMKARQTELDYAIPYAALSSIGDVASVEPDFESGFRVGAKGQKDAVGFDIAYTSLSSSGNDSVSDPVNGDIAGTLIIDNLTAVAQGNIESATARYDVESRAFDANATHDLVKNRRLNVKALGGVKVASIEEEFDVRYDELGSNDFVTVRQTTDMDAFGVNLGLTGGFQLFPGVTLTGTAIYSPMIADVDQAFIYANNTTNPQINLTDNTSRLVSMLDLRVGADVQVYNSPTTQVLVNLGYEFQSLFNYPGLLKHTNESGEITMDHNDSTLTFDGFRGGVTIRWGGAPG